MENMADKMEVPAYAKINLALAVGERRPDGYHRVESIMQQVSLRDRLVLESRTGTGWDFSCTDPALENPDNVVCSAAALLEEYCGRGKGSFPGVSIALHKVVPVEAGLGGGSSDAAAALAALNRFWNLGLGVPELTELASRLGSDVPFFIRGGTAMAYGRGEKLLPLPDLPFCWVVVAVPQGLAFSTAKVYGSFDPEQARRPEIGKLLDAVRRQDRGRVNSWLDEGFTNTLEDAVRPYFSGLDQIKLCFREAGLAPAMSGSGPSIFALSESYRAAFSAARALQLESCRAYLCWTVRQK